MSVFTLHRSERFIRRCLCLGWSWDAPAGWKSGCRRRWRSVVTGWDGGGGGKKSQDSPSTTSTPSTQLLWGFSTSLTLRQTDGPGVTILRQGFHFIEGLGRLDGDLLLVLALLQAKTSCKKRRISNLVHFLNICIKKECAFLILRRPQSNFCRWNYPTFVTRWWYEQHSTTVLQRVHGELVMENQYNVHKKKCSQ